MKYQVGQQVRIVDDKDCYCGKINIGEVVTIIEIHSSDTPYEVQTTKGEEHLYYESDLVPFKKSIRDIEVGDVVIDEDGDTREVLAVCGELFWVDCFYTSAEVYTFAEAEKYGWEVVEEEEEEKDKNPLDILQDKIDTEMIAMLEKRGYTVTKD